MKASSSSANDSFNLDRFVTAQEPIYSTALAELRAGAKRSHWMWYIFPQLRGLGSSSTAQFYAVANLDEARAYLRHELLGPRLIECCRALLSIDGKSASEIMGYPDDLKLRSCVTLFSLVENAPEEFAQVLQKYFEGKVDTRTRELLATGR